MSPTLFRNSGERPDNAQAALKQQADRWKLAVKLVLQMREAGYSCELVATPQVSPQEMVSQARAKQEDDNNPSNQDAANVWVHI
jgi:hypothetical protein